MFCSKSLFLSGLLSAFLLSACKQQASAPPPPKLPVQVLEIQPADVPMTIELPAQTAGSLSTEVRARADGILLSKDYTEGAYVNKGQLLFTIDSNTSSQTVKAAQASLAVQEANLANAQRNWSRVKPLAAQNALSKKDADDARAAFESAQAAVKQARAQLDSAKVNLGYASVRSPISGYTSKETITLGGLITQNMVLTTISQVDPMYAYFSYSEKEFVDLKAQAQAGSVVLPDRSQLQARLKLSDGSEYPIKGVIDFNDTVVNTQTGTIRARAVFANPARTLIPGQFARIQLDGILHRQAVLIPQRSISNSVQGKTVWVLDAQNVAQVRAIEVGDAKGTHVVVTKGLNAGDRVVLDNISKLAQLPKGAALEPKVVTLDSFNTPTNAAKQ